MSKRYKASFETETAYEYSGKHALLLISVGRDYHDGGKFEATIDLVNRGGFGKCTIAVADTLQRHNLSDVTYQQAYEVTADAGDQWVKRNQAAINQLSMKTSLLRWQDCVMDAAYRNLHDRIQFEYGNNRAYRGAINATIDRFLDRLKRRSDDVDLQAAAFRGLTYVIEECPIIMPLWASQGIDFVIYPQPMTQAMAMTRKLFVEPAFPNRVRWLPLKFKGKAGRAGPHHLTPVRPGEKITHDHEAILQ
jgi:tRNA-dependent cyclodipeptide synthase